MRTGIRFEQGEEARKNMKSNGTVKKVVREIEAAKIALGFPRRASYARVERELERYCPSRPGRADLDREVDRPRFLAVASLCLLMDAAQRRDREIVKLRKHLVERVARVRRLARAAA
jgi:hypothetical protein